MDNINHFLSDIGFQLFPPSRELAHFIQCYWKIGVKLESDKSFVYKLIPDGGSGIVFNLGSNFSIKSTNKPYETIERYAVTEPTEKTAYIKLEKSIHTYGIRFLPGGFNAFFPKHTHKEGSLISVFTGKNSELLTRLTNNLTDELSSEELIDTFDKFLISILCNQKLKPDLWIFKAVRSIEKHHGRLTNDALAKMFSLSRRHFERRFKLETGLSPKQFSKIVRVQKARSLISLLNKNSLTEVGYECDYYDQSHFIREFKSAVCETPKDYQKRKKLMSRLYNS